LHSLAGGPRAVDSGEALLSYTPAHIRGEHRMTRHFGSAALGLLLGLCLFIQPGRSLAYPLDGYESTGIKRLDIQRMIQDGKISGKKRPSGELLPLDRVDLRLLDHADMELPTPDPTLTARVKRLVGPDVGRYGITLLDLSDINNPRYAEYNGNQKQNPGSVGKIVVALGIFQALADAHPDDIEARKRVLREALVTADDFSVYDHHTVRIWDAANNKQIRRPIQKGDTATLYTYLDWMMSPSSNSAAGMLQKHLIMLKHFGAAYPVTPAQEAAFFKETSKKELAKIYLDAIESPVTRAGISTDEMRQGSFFTRQGKRLVPTGTSSYATPRGLAKFMLKMEQGKLVDEFSSREIKRLLYITERRIRYGSSGVLRPSAVYFKSGSLYSCQEEAGFVCKKYHGNKRNYMNSIAIIETPAGQERLFYMVSVLSNVLRKNSAQDHRDLARAIHGYLLSAHPEKPGPDGKPMSATYGQGFIGYEAEQAALSLKTDTQEALLALGYEVGEIDGVIGRGTRAAIKKFQQAQGLAANGKPSAELLQRMRTVAQQKGLARPATGAD